MLGHSALSGVKAEVERHGHLLQTEKAQGGVT
jgi:hypothetical protein